MGKSQKTIEKLLIWSIFLITIAVTPFFSYDPINLPRYSILVVSGLLLLFLISSQRTFLFHSHHRSLLTLAVGFVLWSISSLLFSGSDITNGFFGIPGRFNGVLTYISLVIFLVTTSLVSTSGLNLILLKILAFSGLLSALYGLVQYTGQDPFDWINEYSPVFGFFGNPNFQASFLGISSTAVLALILNTTSKNSYRFSFAMYIVFSVFIIAKTKSQQGFLVFTAGASVVLYIWFFYRNRVKHLKTLYIALWIIGAVIVIMDILQKGPWKSFLYKESISYRGDFWRTGWSMTTDNPIFGVGLGGYGDNFRKYRDLVSANRIQISSNVDSAHNILIDLSSGGGFPLLIFYLGLMLLTLVSAIKIIKRSSSFDFVFAGIFGAWVAYTAQSLISVNQIGIAIWGWVLSGAIIGYEINDRLKRDPITSGKDSATVLAVSGGLIMGLLLTMPFLISDTQFRSTVRSGDVNKIILAVQRWPQSVENMNFVTILLRNGGFPEQSLIIARKSVKLYPRSFEAWQQLFSSLNATETERSKALEKMRELDPLNLTLK